MLRPDLNQVAGHGSEGGVVGSLVDDQGRFYKPLQDNDRGDKEVQFYEKFWADETVLQSGKKFFPGFYGIKHIEADNGSGFSRHAILENLIWGYRKPSVVDIKVGARTWYPEAGEAYIRKCIEKDSSSTSAALGLRIAGIQAYDAGKDSKWKPERKWSKKLTTDMVAPTLTRFASKNPLDETDFDGGFIECVYGGPKGIVAQLAELIAWFEVQTSYHFHSASVLFVFEGDCDSKENSKPPSLKLVDFAHVLYGKGTIDQNFLDGLKSLYSILSKLVDGKSEGAP